MLGGKKEREDCVGGGAEEAGRPEGRLLQYRCEDAGGKKQSFGKTLLGRGDASVCLSAKPQKQVFLLAFNLPRYRKSEGLSACYMLL